MPQELLQTNVPLWHPAPPKTPGWPGMGVLPHMLKDPLTFWSAARQRHGDLYTLDLGLMQVIMLNHPRHAQHVLLDQAHNYRKGGVFWDTVRTMLGNGLPVSEGDFWRRQRRLMQPQFHRQQLSGMTESMIDAIDEVMAGWDAVAASAKPFNLGHQLLHMTMKVIVKTMFGSGLTVQEAERMTVAMRHTMDYMIQGMITQALPRWLPMPGQRSYRAAIRTIDELLLQVIERRRHANSEAHDLLTLLLHMVDDETGEGMTDQQLRDEVISIFLAGYETTAAALGWSFHYLTQQPGLGQRLQSEVDTVLGERRPSFADVPKLTYTRMALQETLRLYPPGFWLPRTAIEDDVIDGFAILAGKMVAVTPYIIQRHPDLWSDPAQFDPERFAPERAADAVWTQHKLAWLPFGAGQRQCIGRDFALMEGQLILARIMQRYVVAAVPGRTAKPHVAATLRTKDGVWVTLQWRA